MISLTPYPTFREGLKYLEEAFRQAKIADPLILGSKLTQLQQLGLTFLVFVDGNVRVDNSFMEFCYGDWPHKYITISEFYGDSPHVIGVQIGLKLSSSDVMSLQRETNSLLERGSTDVQAFAANTFGQCADYRTSIGVLITYDEQWPSVGISDIHIFPPIESTMIVPCIENEKVRLIREEIILLAKKLIDAEITALASLGIAIEGEETLEVEKISKQQLREFALAGWLIGRGYKIGDSILEKRHEVWDELKKADRDLFFSESKNKGDIASTPKKFFKDQKPVPIR